MKKPTDPVTAYASGVVKGSIVAGRMVRMACQRHLADLEDGQARGLVWKPKQAERAIEFFADVLRLPEETAPADEQDDTPPEGSPFMLRPWQQFIVGSLMGWYMGDHRRFRTAYVETSKGSGKALALDTPIATPSGWTTMGEIKAGDTVFDDAGRQTRVLKISDVMHDHPCFEVAFDDGSVIVADAEHLWQTEMRRVGTVPGDTMRGVPLRERGKWRHGLRTTAEIAATLRNSNGKYQSTNHSVALAGPLGLPVADLPIEPYVLGVWLGDGDSDCARITVADADAELLEHVAACGISVGERKSTSRAPRYRIGGSSARGSSAPNSLNAILRRNGMLNAQKHIPAAYLRGSVDQRLALLQGLMDTDGCISPENGACEFCSTDEPLARGVLELVVSLGIKCAIHESAAKLYGREVSRRWRLHFHPPADLPVFRLRRKLKHQIVRHNRRRLSGERRIVDVRPVASVPVKCIAVDSPSHLYLAGESMIPTHNTPLGAGLMLYLLVADGERVAQVFAAAVGKDQAKLAFTDAERMVEASPELRNLLDRKVNNIAYLAEGSFFRPISSEKRGLDGKRVHGALIDELHEHPTSVVVDKMRAGTKGRRSALILEITNSGYDRESVCWHHHEYSREVLEGTIENDAWFAYVCQLDPCETHVAAGKRSPVEGCPDCDDWKTEGPHWLKVNPNLGVSLPWQYLREQVTEAIGMPSKRNIVRRLNFCEWTDQVTIWIPTEKWVACAQTPPPLAGRSCFVGIDVSSKIDLTAVALLFPREASEPALEVDLGPDWQGEQPHERPSTNRTFNLNRRYDLLSNFWMPKETLAVREGEDRVPFGQWAQEGHLRVTTGSMVDQDEILDTIIKEFATRYRILGIGIDTSNAAAMVTRLQTHFGPDKVIDIPQGFRHLSEPSKIFEALVMSARIHHGNNKAMNWCVSNVGKEESKWGDIRPVKVNQRKRIDGVVAVIDAIRVSTLVPEPRPKNRRPARVWTPNGFVPIVPPTPASDQVGHQ